jgi:ADP-ribose pyrophosphatase YjhB (NUDIX family)
VGLDSSPYDLTVSRALHFTPFTTDAPPKRQAKCGALRIALEQTTLMNYCSNCGHHPVPRIIPPGDSRERFCCPQCGAIHYQNPRNVGGTVTVWGQQVLLCRRAIAPRHGYWTLPAGFMEIGETTSQCAARETLEEAGARVEIGPLFSLLNVPHVEQVHLFYLARLLDRDIAAGEESLEVRLFSENEIPWDELAFQTVSQTLRFFFADRRDGTFTLHTGDIAAPIHPL